MKRSALVVALSCSSQPTKPVEQETHVAQPAPRDGASEGVAPSGKGDVQVRVEWHDVPIAVRSSPGRTPCGTAAAPAVVPTTTWGVPDALVAIDAPGAAPDRAARIIYDHCAFVPRASVAGANLTVTTTADAPVALAIARQGEGGDTRAIELPIAGHAVDVPLAAGGLYKLSAPSAEAWILAAPGPFAAATDATGQAVLRDMPAGHYKITAWLPPRVAHGEVEVVAGALAEVTLDVGKP